MGRNLTPLYISSSFQYLVQTSGSEFQDGLGNTLTSVNITASEATYALTAASATTATSASHALIADTALNVPSINTGSLLENASVTDAVTTYTRADGTTFATTAINNVANATSALIAVSASHAVIADSALSANTATTATTASYVLIGKEDGLYHIDTMLHFIAGAEIIPLGVYSRVIYLGNGEIAGSEAAYTGVVEDGYTGSLESSFNVYLEPHEIGRAHV